MTLDSVLTVAIGRNMADGGVLDDDDWAGFRTFVWQLLDDNGTVVCQADSVGGAIGSDGVNDGVAEDSCVFVAINVGHLDSVRVALADILQTYGQTSACFAYDGQHEPCFADTTDGYRPSLPFEDSVTVEYRELESMLRLSESLSEGSARRSHGFGA